ncbi:MAG: hypothetical protein Q4B09_02605 [Lachnospiraceae bacterium]|nr:hypothetical protein [Lachnospiraceae bacterium]
MYVNERARYGERRTLNRNALLLFLSLHFMNPDENGLVRMVDAEEAAEMLGCHVRTVINNLRLLEEAGYIACRKLPIVHYYDIFISEYSTYFKQASADGRGYLTMSQGMLQEIISQTSLNAVRLVIRSVLSSEEDMRRKGSLSEKSYQEIKLDLPDYCTRKQIREITDRDSFRRLFHVTQKKRTASIILKEEFEQSTVRELLREDARAAILKKLSSLQETAAVDAQQGESTAVLSLTEKELTDISAIALKYPIACITRALEQIYTRYVRHHLDIRNIGALVRTFARANAELFQAA